MSSRSPSREQERGAAARRLLEVAGAIKTTEANLGSLKEERGAVRKQLVRLGIKPGIEYLLDGVRVTRTIVSGRSTYDITAALEDGVVTEDELEPYLKVGDPYEVWPVKAAGDADSAIRAASKGRRS